MKIPLSKLVLALALFAAMAHPCAAKDKKSDSKKLELGPAITAEEAAKIHLKRFLTDDHKNLEKSYAKQVTLMPGHEFLKPEYGLVGEGKRTEAAKVERAKLVALTKENPREMPEELVEKLLGVLGVEAFKTKPGDFATEPADPVETPDGKLHFQIKAGDVLIKIAPRKKGGDFLLFQFRAIGSEWKVVAEYLD